MTFDPLICSVLLQLATRRCVVISPIRARKSVTTSLLEEASKARTHAASSVGVTTASEIQRGYLARPEANDCGGNARTCLTVFVSVKKIE